MAKIFDFIEDDKSSKDASILLRLTLADKRNFDKALDVAQKKTKKKISMQSILEAFVKSFIMENSPKG